MINQESNSLFFKSGMSDIATVLRLTYDSLKQNFAKLMSSVGLWLLVYVLADLLYGMWVVQDPETNQLGFIGSLVLGVIDGMMWVLIAVRTHRVIVGDNSSTSEQQRLSNVDSYFLFTIRLIWLAILIGLCVAIGVMAGSFGGSLHAALGIPIGAAVILFGFWHAARLFLSLPSLAVRQQMSMSESSALTREYQILMFFICLLPIVVYGVPSYVFSLVFASNLELVVVSNAVLTLMITVAEIALLSITYSYVIDRTSSTQPSD